MVSFLRRVFCADIVRPILVLTVYTNISVLVFYFQLLISYCQWMFCKHAVLFECPPSALPNPTVWKVHSANYVREEQHEEEELRVVVDSALQHRTKTTARCTCERSPCSKPAQRAVLRSPPCAVWHVARGEQHAGCAERKSKRE